MAVWSSVQEIARGCSWGKYLLEEVQDLGSREASLRLASRM